MSKTAKTYLIYAGLGLIPVFLVVISSKFPNYFEGPNIHHFSNVFQYPLYMGFALVGFMCFKLNQNRILFSVLLYLGVCYALTNPLTLNAMGFGLKGLYYVIAMSFPLTLAVVFSIREARPMDLPNFGRLFSSLIPFAVLSYLLARDLPVFSKIAGFEIFPGLNPKSGFFLSQWALVSLAVFGAVIFMQRDRIVKPFTKVLGITMIPLMSIIWVVLKLFHEFWGEHPKYNLKELQGWMASTFPSLQVIAAFTVICGILLHTIFQMYWHRVYVDELTDISNRRALEERLSSMTGEYAIAMMDIDHFKDFNDTYGHDEGDNVLKLVGGLLSEELGDKVYRYGGEEFCAVFEGVSGEDAYMYVNKVRRKLEEREFFIRKPNSKREHTSRSSRKKKKRNGKKVQVTISIGLASSGPKSKTAGDVIKLADRALYQAKKKGRNRVVIWEIDTKKSSTAV